MVGLATAWALERQGFACLVFEQGAPGGGLSAGESRTFRHAHDDPRQFEVALDARQGWSEWEEAFETRLISPDGAIALGSRAVSRLRRYENHPAIEVREPRPEDLRKVLPVMGDFDGPVLFDESAGAIRTRLTLASLIGAVGLNLVPERVERVVPLDGGGVELVSSFGPRKFDAVVVAAGMGTPYLAKVAGLTVPKTTRAQVRLTFPLTSSLPAHRLACLQDTSGTFGEAAAYGSPVRGNRQYVVGLETSVDIEQEGGNAHLLDQLAERTRDYVDQALPGLDPARGVAVQRWVTNLPWADDGLAIWQAGDAYFVAGHNLFRLAPALGKALADSVAAGRVEPGFRPEDRLGRPLTREAGPTG